MSDISPEDEALFMQDIASLQNQYGVELDDDDVQAIANASFENGWSDEATAQAFQQITGAGGPYDEDEYDLEEGEVDEEQEADLEQDSERFGQDVHTELTGLQNKLGRELTSREQQAIGQRLIDQAQRYDQISAEAALDDYHEQGGRKLDLDGGTNESRRADRRAFMNEQLQDAQAANKPDNSDREYDLDKHSDRVGYMMERLNGTEFVEAEAGSDDEAA